MKTTSLESVPAKPEASMSFQTMKKGFVWNRLLKVHVFIKGMGLRLTKPTQAVCLLLDLNGGFVQTTPTEKPRFVQRNGAPLQTTNSSVLPSVGWL
jgi:hypothetical protein